VPRADGAQSVHATPDLKLSEEAFPAGGAVAAPEDDATIEEATEDHVEAVSEEAAEPAAEEPEAAAAEPEQEADEAQPESDGDTAEHD
jgi:hypothetical protein